LAVTQVLVSGDLVGQLRASSELVEGGNEVHLVHLGLHHLSVNTEEDPFDAAVSVVSTAQFQGSTLPSSVFLV
jgi:hypothetical protein